jgi:hypothetical protein
VVLTNIIMREQHRLAMERAAQGQSPLGLSPSLLRTIGLSPGYLAATQALTPDVANQALSPDAQPGAAEQRERLAPPASPTARDDGASSGGASSSGSSSSSSTSPTSSSTTSYGVLSPTAKVSSSGGASVGGSATAVEHEGHTVLSGGDGEGGQVRATGSAELGKLSAEGGYGLDGATGSASVSTVSMTAGVAYKNEKNGLEAAAEATVAGPSAEVSDKHVKVALLSAEGQLEGAVGGDYLRLKVGAEGEVWVGAKIPTGELLDPAKRRKAVQDFVKQLAPGGIAHTDAKIKIMLSGKDADGGFSNTVICGEYDCKTGELSGDVDIIGAYNTKKVYDADVAEGADGRAEERRAAAAEVQGRKDKAQAIVDKLSKAARTRGLTSKEQPIKKRLEHHLKNADQPSWDPDAAIQIALKDAHASAAGSGGGPATTAVPVPKSPPVGDGLAGDSPSPSSGSPPETSHERAVRLSARAQALFAERGVGSDDFYTSLKVLAEEFPDANIGKPGDWEEMVRGQANFKQAEGEGMGGKAQAYSDDMRNALHQALVYKLSKPEGVQEMEDAGAYDWFIKIHGEEFVRNGAFDLFSSGPQGVRDSLAILHAAMKPGGTADPRDPRGQANIILVLKGLAQIAQGKSDPDVKAACDKYATYKEALEKGKLDDASVKDLAQQFALMAAGDISAKEFEELLGSAQEPPEVAADGIGTPVVEHPEEELVTTEEPVAQEEAPVEEDVALVPPGGDGGADAERQADDEVEIEVPSPTSILLGTTVPWLDHLLGPDAGVHHIQVMGRNDAEMTGLLSGYYNSTTMLGGSGFTTAEGDAEPASLSLMDMMSGPSPYALDSKEEATAIRADMLPDSVIAEQFSRMYGGVSHSGSGSLGYSSGQDGPDARTGYSRTAGTGYETGRRIRSEDSAHMLAISSGYGAAWSAALNGTHDGSASLDGLGGSATLDASIRADILRIMGQTQVGGSQLGGSGRFDATLGGNMTGRGRLDAEGVDLSASAMVGAEASGRLEGHVGPVGASVSGSGIAGVGGRAHLHIGMDGNNFVLSGELAAAYGLGGSVGARIEINVQSVVEWWHWLTGEQQEQVKGKLADL